MAECMSSPSHLPCPSPRAPIPPLLPPLSCPVIRIDGDQATLHAELEAIDHLLPFHPAPLSSITLYVT
jgi:hypothetical protein